jgi:hypothetical protein
MADASAGTIGRAGSALRNLSQARRQLIDLPQEICIIPGHRGGADPAVPRPVAAVLNQPLSTGRDNAFHLPSRAASMSRPSFGSPPPAPRLAPLTLGVAAFLLIAALTRLGLVAATGADALPARYWPEALLLGTWFDLATLACLPGRIASAA